jgi:hypothetical protein
VEGSGGSRPLTGPDDGRVNRNTFADVFPGTESHHLCAPGDWLPRARVRVPDDEVREVGVPYRRFPFHLMPLDDLMPHERKLHYLGS